MTKSIFTDNGKIVALDRTYRAVPTYTAPSRIRVGINQAEPFEADTTLTQRIPLSNGTINDNGDNTLTGANGGTNTTDNTTTYKPGGGVSDNVAQNLIVNGTSVNKDWYISNLAALGVVVTGTYRAGFWLYIKDTTTLAYLTASSCVELRLGSDNANYYYLRWDKTALAVGWNFLSTGTTAVSSLTQVGAVAGAIDYFMLRIITNNAADAWASGDAVYDMLRSWQDSDEYITQDAGYPDIDEANKKATMRFFISSTQANGYDLNGISIENTDVTPKVTDIEEFNDESKSDTDEIIFIVRNKIQQG